MRPSPRFAALFPGQLSEKASMGEALAGAFPYVGDFFAEVEARTGVSMERVYFGDGSPELHADLPAQVGVFAVSVAALDVLEREHGLRPAHAAGYSLGTYAAFVAAGAVDRWAALDVLLEVERLLSSYRLGGAMGYVIGMTLPQVEALLEELGLPEAEVAVATENAAQQFVLTGSFDGLALALHAARPNALRAEALPLRWPMHSPRLALVTRRLRAFVEERVELAAPRRATLWAPMLGRAVESREEAVEVLVEQIARPSAWRSVLEGIAAAGVSAWAEVGPGDVLSKMLPWTVRRARAAVLEDPDAIASFAASHAPFEGAPTAADRRVPEPA